MHLLNVLNCIQNLICVQKILRSHWSFSYVWSFSATTEAQISNILIFYKICMTVFILCCWLVTFSLILIIPYLSTTFFNRRQRSLSRMERRAQQTLSMATLQRDAAQGEEFWFRPSQPGLDPWSTNLSGPVQSELSRMDPHRASMLHVFACSGAIVRYLGSGCLRIHHQSSWHKSRSMRRWPKVQFTPRQSPEVRCNIAIAFLKSLRYRLSSSSCLNSFFLVS